MENASKALLMAGGILIALLIIGSLFLMFSNLQSYQDNNDDIKKSTQVAEFNNQFEPYNKDGLTLMQLKSIYNKIVSNNVQHPEYPIQHNIDRNFLKQAFLKISSVSAAEAEKDAEKFLSVEGDTNTDGFRTIYDGQKQKLKFNCIKNSIKYENQDGRISQMNFEIKN